VKLSQNIHFTRLAGVCLVLLLSLFAGNQLQAAGIKDIAPTEADSPVMLESGRIGFNNFADFGGAPEGRLYVSFGRADEVLYLGLAPGYDNDGDPFTNTVRSRYRFQIKKDNPDGPDDIVHGPFTVTNLNANARTYAEAEYGVYSVDQLVSGDSMYVFRPGEAGDYYIEFDDATVSSRRVNIPFWDFTVVRDASVREGRVWSRGWAFRTPQVTGTTPPDCVWDREFNGTLFSYTEDGFVSKIDFQDSGFQGLSFNIAFNETGPGTSGNLAEDRKSVPGLNETVTARQHRIFLSLPDIEIFPDGICGEVTAGESFVCGGVEPYCLEVEVTRQGQVEIILDFDGNGLLDDNGMDVALVYDFPADSLTACIPWNGLLADNTPVNFTDTVDVIINYAQGVQHYSAYDVEFLKNGFCVETVRPTCNQGQLTSSRLYYDDREIPEDPGTGASKDGRDGCDCGDGCRTWDNFALNPGGTCNTFDDDETVGYGDKSTLNTYWFASSQSEFRARVPVVSANIVGNTDLCGGMTSLLTAVDNGIEETPTYLWEGPGVEGLTTDTVRISQAGTYCVTIFDPSGCESRTCIDASFVDFDVNPFPSETSICFGESVTLPVGGNPSYDYVWSPATGIDDINSNQPTFNPTETTTYSVVITNNSIDGGGCTETEEVIITVFPDIDLQITGDGPSCDPTTTITVTTAVTADVVLFNAAGTQIGTGTTFTLDVNGLASYLLVATDNQNCPDSLTFTVSGEPIDANLFPDDTSTCFGGSVTLPVAGNPAYSYVWSPATGIDDINSNQPTFNPTETTTYSVVITHVGANGQTCTATEEVIVTVFPDIDLQVTGDGPNCDPTSTITVTTAVAADIALFNAAGTQIGTGNSFTLDVDGETDYLLVATDAQNCTDSLTFTVTGQPVDLNLFPDDTSICFGESTTLAVAGNPAYDYVWSPAAGIDDVNSNQPTFNPTVTTTYSVVITNNSGSGVACSRTEEIVVNVGLDINLQVIGGGPICDPTTTITASTAVDAEIVLFDPSGAQIGTGTVFTLDVSGESDYLLVATDAQNCTDSITFTVSGGPVDISVPDTVLTCLSDGVNLAVTNLDANDDLTYLWAPAELFDPATITTANPSFIGDPGDYAATVTVTNQYNCVVTEDVRIIVIDDNGALSFTSMVDCDGSTVTFTNTSTVSFGYIYSFGDGSTSTDTNPVHVYDSPGTYTVTLDLVYDQNCVASFTQEVTTFPLVLDAGLTVGLDGCANGSATLNFMDASTNATGSGLTYAWTFTGVTPTTSMDQNPSVTVSGSGTVTASLEVTSADNCTSTLDTSFTVDLAEINLMEEIIICPGDFTELNPGADAGFTYNWAPANGFDPTEPNPTTGVAGTYIVTVTATSADFNCTNTDTVTVVIADDIGLVVNGPDGPIDNGNGGVVELSSLETCGNPVDLSFDLTTNDGVDVVYTDLDGNVLGMGGSLTVNPDGRDTIVVTATNEFGCIERDTVVIINTQVDAGIDVGADGLNFCSSVDTVLSVINFDPADTLTYAWGANDIITGSLTNQTVNITSPAEGSVDIFLTVTNQFGCDTMLVVTVTATPFTPNQYADVIQPCFKDAFTINGGPRVDGYVYEWMPDDNLDLTDPANPIGSFEEDGPLMVTITDPTTGCTSTQTINVDVAPEISFMASPMDTVICAPANITINGSSVNEDVDIVWYDDEDLTNQVGTGSTYVVEASEVGETYTVYGEATDPNTGCSQVVPVTVSVSDITAGLPLEDVNACAGGRTSIFAPGGVISTLNYTYNPADLIDSSDPDNPVFVGNSSATITVTAIDPATGCSATQTVDVNLTDLGDLTGAANPEEIFLGDDSELTVIGECVGCTYEWMGGNGTIVPNTGQTVIVTPDQVGDATYEVEVTQNGCTRILQITVRVLDPLCDFEHIYIPNAFTPNRDSRNDVMRVRSNFADQITEFQWIIYDRWGQEVYNSDDINGSWDGTVEGDDLEPDVYGYWLRLTCPNGDPFIKQGNITILR
jgi:gliding motility-associated-like protein